MCGVRTDWEIRFKSESGAEGDLYDEDDGKDENGEVVERPDIHDPGEFVRQTLNLHFHAGDESKPPPTLPVNKTSRLKDYLLTGVEDATEAQIPKRRRSVTSPRVDESSEEPHRSRAGTALSGAGTIVTPGESAMTYVTNPVGHPPHQHKAPMMRPDDPLVRAVLQGNTKLVKKLLKEGFSPMEVDPACNLTALQMASKTGNADLVTMLLEVGAGASEGLSNKLTQRPYLDETDDDTEREPDSPEKNKNDSHLPEGNST
eukprot:gene27988-34603_t